MQVRLSELISRRNHIYQLFEAFVSRLNKVDFNYRLLWANSTVVYTVAQCTCTVLPRTMAPAVEPSLFAQMGSKIQMNCSAKPDAQRIETVSLVLTRTV